MFIILFYFLNFHNKCEVFSEHFKENLTQTGRQDLSAETYAYIYDCIHKKYVCKHIFHFVKK